jgi:hypothetical protein
MLQRFEAILIFYKPYIFGSLAVNLIIAIINPSIFIAVVTKLFLVLILWYLMKETSSKNKLVFYKNIGISNLKLFSSLFLIDIFITIAFILVIQEFI